MQTRVQTIGTCKENSTTGERNVRFTIREKSGRLMTRRLRKLAEEHVITYVPEKLLEDLVNEYNAEIGKLGMTDQYQIDFKAWPDDGAKKEQLIVDLIDRRHDLIKVRHILESQDSDKQKGTRLLGLFDDMLQVFEETWATYDDLFSRGDITLNPVEKLTDMHSKLLADAAADAAAKELGSDVGGWL